jgi:RND family efflux transporter MFP subunit
MKKERRSFLLRVVLPVLVLVIGLLAAGYFWFTREQPQKQAGTQRGALVTTVEVTTTDQQLDVEAQGQVIPARRVQLNAQVSGRIDAVDPDLVPGGVVREGDILVRVEQEDFQYAVREARAAVEQAESQLELELGRQEVAEAEWKLFGEEVPEDMADPALALREPQLESARAELARAKARLEQAQLNLDRSTVQAPFDAFVESESAEIGQLVGPQAPIATLIGIERFWVEVPVPVARLGDIEIPGYNAQVGSPVLVRQDAGRETIERRGRILRLYGDLDEAGRMARLLVEVEDPLGLESAPRGEQTLPLLVNAYVDVNIEGRRVDGLVEVPRQAIHEGDLVYVFDDGELDIRPVEIAWRQPDSVLVRSGIEPGERVVTSPVPTPVAGMKLRRTEGDGADGERRAEGLAPGAEADSPAATSSRGRGGARAGGGVGGGGD